MSRQARRDTAPELAIRSALFRAGERYRVNLPVPGLRRCSIDVAFPRRKVAVFVDGCFWHACPTHGTAPKSNAQWWAEKLSANVARDRTIDSLLAAQGWVVVRVWEHETPDVATRRIMSVLSGRTIGEDREEGRSGR